MSRPDHYATLGVAPDASMDDIKRAYRRAARHAHPDRGGSDERMQALNQAKDVLTDPERRARYDAGEDDQPADEDADARAIILKLFTEAVDINKVDPVAGAREALQAGRANAAAKIASLRGKINRLGTQHDRVTAKTERNLFLDVLNARIAEARGTIALMEATQRTADRALAILDAEYEPGPAVVREQERKRERDRYQNDGLDAFSYGILSVAQPWRGL